MTMHELIQSSKEIHRERFFGPPKYQLLKLHSSLFFLDTISDLRDRINERSGLYLNGSISIRMSSRSLADDSLIRELSDSVILGVFYLHICTFNPSFCRICLTRTSVLFSRTCGENCCPSWKTYVCLQNIRRRNSHYHNTSQNQMFCAEMLFRVFGIELPGTKLLLLQTYVMCVCDG